jgi:hypothetical protein
MKGVFKLTIVTVGLCVALISAGLSLNRRERTKVPLSNLVDSKVAWLFLTTQDFPLKRPWKRWFGPHLAVESIWFGKETGCVTFCDDVPFCRCVNAPSRWGYLEKITAKLLEEALANPTKEHFLFLSDTTLPLIPFEDVVGQITQTSDSLFCMLLENKTFFSRELDRPYYRGMAFKHDQWVILNRKHATALAIGLKTHFSEKEFHNPSGVAGDEILPFMFSLNKEAQSVVNSENLLDIMSNNSMRHFCSTFMIWGPENSRESMDRFKGLKLENSNSVDHPYIFQQITGPFWHHIVSEGFLFIRKFQAHTEFAFDERAVISFLLSTLQEG